MGQFSNLLRRDGFKSFFTKIGLPWDVADYTRTNVFRNDTAIGPVAVQLPGSYSQKANFLKNVSRDKAWYLPHESSTVQSMVFAPEKVENQDRTPVAFATVGDGKFGYIGDVNAEVESNAVILAMCGLLEG